eukprot:CAMPEP_0184514836 /NCGR_PEP_ID=MMETSP0198_2-20121128/4178_1 /TAXON_ID=1112570 /ORGANISM="Thraustochytrium sp., Strain LLF1b" /LENGTH=113 /DNA_ID=CAMNT_0026905057 /DNA_START=1302 /DNA_END=1643 /DNA_ORIENTATION=+
MAPRRAPFADTLRRSPAILARRVRERERERASERASVCAAHVSLRLRGLRPPFQAYAVGSDPDVGPDGIKFHIPPPATAAPPQDLCQRCGAAPRLPRLEAQPCAGVVAVVAAV